MIKLKLFSKSNIRYAAFGVLIGAVNGLLGSGGGTVAVLILKKLGLDQKTAQANAVAVILPISVFTSALYVLNGNVKISESLMFLPTGLLGAFIGTALLCRVSPKILKKAFGGFMVFAGIRLLLK